MDNDDLIHRLQNLLGVDMTGVNATGLMTDGHLTDEPKGIVATNADGTAFGMAEILLENMSNVMAAYDMSPTQYAAGWAGCLDGPPRPPPHNSASSAAWVR